MRNFQQDLIDKLDNLQEESPKAYWNLLGKLKQCNEDKNKNESNIDLDKWHEYFEDLNMAKNEKSSSQILEKLKYF